jgi:hypothetical protein
LRKLFSSTIYIVVIILFVIFMTSCVSGKKEYTPPSSITEFKNTIIVNRPVDEVWSIGIANIGKSFFVINTIEKVSGILNISYAGDPEKFIDCGIVSTEITNARGTRNYTFNGAKEQQTYETLEKVRKPPFGVEDDELCVIDRAIKLDGRFNIVVQKVDDVNTSISVNGRYIVTRTIHIKSAIPIGPGINKNSVDTIHFNSNGCATFPGGTKCCALGNLEKDVLELFK